MNWYQSFTHFADGTWDIEFHKQSPDHPDFIIQVYYSKLRGWGWIFKPFTRHWRVDNHHIMYL
ncbi:hypothetical protein C6499_22705 [Candidatus Poribacteria bacterium]|nr:MAG: hypothetical protein C6499_22705 [Candidatus Poribacteria bacterium]